MKVTPKTEEEVSKFKICPEGEYAFEVIKAIEKLSKAGNEMIEVVLKVWDDEGKEYLVYDYLMDKLEYKIRHFCDGTGLLDKYNAGLVSDVDCIGKTGRVVIKHQKDRDDETKMRHTVKDYIKSGDNTTKSVDTFEGDDDIPF